MKTNLIMKRSLVLSLVLILFLIFPAQPAEASQKPEDKTARLQYFGYSTSSLSVGFYVTGFTENTDIRGAIYVDKQFNVLHCQLAQTHEVKCFAEGMKRYRGRNARIWFAGLPFYIKMPGDLPEN
jgi:hypothetical protein